MIGLASRSITLPCAWAANPLAPGRTERLDSNSSFKWRRRSLPDGMHTLRIAPGTHRSTRRGRRRSRRGVSPVIATILLVAITVVLAATFYLFLIPLFPHSNTPLSGNLAWGTVTCYGGAGTNCQSSPGYSGCASGDYCWSIGIESVSSAGVSAADLNLYVQNASQLTVSTANWTFYFLTNTNPQQLYAFAPGSIAGASGSGWIAGSGHSTTDALNDAINLWIDTGSSTSFSNHALVLQTTASSGGAFSGSLPAFAISS